MRTHKLEGVDAFVVLDLDGDGPAAGLVRQAPKILVDGAQLLARTVTYTYAAFERRAGGASAGVNAPADGRAAALAGFVDGVAPLVGSGLTLLPGRGVGEDDLAPLAAAAATAVPAAPTRAALLAAGVAAAAEALAGGLDGRTVAIEGYEHDGEAVARALVARGATIVAVGTAEGTAATPGGLAVDALAEAAAGGTTGLAGRLAADPGPPAAVLAAGADVLVVGSKAGVVDHHAAAAVAARVLVPLGPVPVTAKGLAVLRRGGVAVLPDFVTAAGPWLAVGPDAITEPDAVAGAVAAAVADVGSHADGPLLGACHRAEAFLRSWQDTLPFGRPLA